MVDADVLNRVRDKAFEVMGTGDWAGAELRFAQLLEHGPDDPVLRMHRGECLVQLERPAEALEVTEPCRAHEPVWWLALGVRADALTALGRYDEAAACRAEHLAVNETVDGLVLLASERRRQRRLDEAIELLRRAVEREPEFEEPHRLLGVCLHDERRHDEAVPHLERALALNDDPAMRRSLWAHLQRARVGLNEEQWQDAYDRADELAYEGKPEEARPLFERLLMARPDSRIWYPYAQCLVELGEVPRAIAALDWCRGDAREWSEALRLLQEIHEARGEHGRAEELRQQWLALQKTLPKGI